MSTTQTLVTAEEFLATSFDVPTELVRGAIVETPPTGMRHGVVCQNVGFLLESWNRANDAGFVPTNDSAVRTERDPDTVRGPDVYFVSRERLPGEVPAGAPDVVPDLCVEVLSPSDRWGDVVANVGEYLRSGVREVWVLDPEPCTVCVFRQDGEPAVLEVGDELATDVLPGFARPVAEFFRGL